jgi:hypothetical protein
MPDPRPVKKLSIEEVRAVAGAAALFGPNTEVALFEFEGALHVEAVGDHTGHAIHRYDESEEFNLLWLDDVEPWAKKRAQAAELEVIRAFVGRS